MKFLRYRLPDRPAVFASLPSVVPVWSEIVLDRPPVCGGKKGFEDTPPIGRLITGLLAGLTGPVKVGRSIGLLIGLIGLVGLICPIGRPTGLSIGLVGLTGPVGIGRK